MNVLRDPYYRQLQLTAERRVSPEGHTGQTHRPRQRMAKDVGCGVVPQQQQPYNNSCPRRRQPMKTQTSCSSYATTHRPLTTADVPSLSSRRSKSPLANNTKTSTNKPLAAARSDKKKTQKDRRSTMGQSLAIPCSSSHNNTTPTTTTTRTTTPTITTSKTQDREDEPCLSSVASRGKHRRRFPAVRSSTLLKRILSSTFKDLSLGYYISIVMVISFKIFIFANTLNTVMGAKTFYMHWNTSNSIFRIDNTDHIIDVNKGNLAFEYDQVHIICPVYEPGTFDNETEKLIIYNVSKAEYETCRITNANPRIIAVCDKPQKLMYFTITFRPFTPSPGGLEFLPGHDYYFISTSSKDDLHRRIGGRCSTNNMKVVFKVCCGGGGTSDQGGTLTIGEGNRTSPARGNTKKALAVTTPLPSVKIWSVPSSPAVVSNRPTINQPVVLQNDFVQTPVQNHSYGSGGQGGGPGSSSNGNWQSSTAATKKTLKPSDFDKRANEVVKYDQELNVNEKSTSNEMVGGDAFSWRQQQRHLGVLLGSVLVTVVAVFRLRWLY